MAGVSKEHFYLLNNSGQLVTGATLTFRSVGGSTDLFTFTEAQTGLYVIVADTGLYDFYVNGVLQSALSPWLHIDSAVLPAPVTGTTDLFGDGSDGTYTLDGTQGTVAGLFTKDSGTHYTLLRDGMFQNLTINTGVTLASNGYRVHVKGTLTLPGNVDNSGGVGGAGGAGAGSGGAGGAGGVAATQAPSGYLATSGVSGGGGAGGNGSALNNGSAGNVGSPAPSSVVNGIGATGLNGAAGGNSNCANGGGSGAAGSYSALPAADGGARNIFNAYLSRAFAAATFVSINMNGTNGGSGGGASGCTGTGGSQRGSGGGGGASGANGGIMVVAANTITGAGAIRCDGGAGGVGGAGGNSGGDWGAGGGGGGGNGGNGGWLTVIYRVKTGFTGTLSAAGGALANGGAAGTGGSQSTNVQAGANGSAGVAGLVSLFAV